MFFRKLSVKCGVSMADSGTQRQPWDHCSRPAARHQSLCPARNSPISVWWISKESTGRIKKSSRNKIERIWELSGLGDKTERKIKGIFKIQVLCSKFIELRTEFWNSRGGKMGGDGGRHWSWVLLSVRCMENNQKAESQRSRMLGVAWSPEPGKISRTHSVR